MTSEVQVKCFDYTQLEPETSRFLSNKEILMRACVGSAYTELGEHLSEARDRLANNKSGVFEEWYTALGFSRNTVYRLIQRYEFILPNWEDKAMLEDLPLSLTYEVSKPSAPEELKQAVLDGDITTHKQYREMEAKLRDSEQRIKTLQGALEAELNKSAPEPKVITVEKIPQATVDLMVKRERELKEAKERLEETEAQLVALRDKRGDVAELEAKKREMEQELAEMLAEVRQATAGKEYEAQQAHIVQAIAYPIGHLVKGKGRIEQTINMGVPLTERSRRSIMSYVHLLRDVANMLADYANEEVVEYVEYREEDRGEAKPF